MSDPSRLVRAVDAIERVLAARVEIERTRTHWIAGAAFDIVRKRAESPLLILGRRPSRPFFLAAHCGHAGPGLSILAYDRAVADRLTFGKHVVNVACGGIDQDRAWRFLPVVYPGRPNSASKKFCAEAVAAEVSSVVTVMPVTSMSLTPRLKRVWRRINKGSPDSRADDPQAHHL